MKKPKRVVEGARPFILPLIAAVLFAAFAAVSLWPQIEAAADETVDNDHSDHDHGGYLTNIEYVKTIEFTPKDGETFTISADGDGFYLEDGCDPERLLTTALYASALPYVKDLGVPEVPLSDYGLDSPKMQVTVNGEVSFSVGDITLDKGAYYTLMDGEVFLVEAELAGQLLLSKNAYRLLKLWPGEPGDYPALTEISLSIPAFSSTLGGYKLIRNDLDDDAPLGLSRYELTSPIQFSCNDDAVREKVLSRIYSIDLDDIAVGVEIFEFACHTLTLKGDDFEQTIYISRNNTVQDGGRYLKLEGNDTVYIDRLGDYSFLEIEPLDLTYGLAFWLYKMDDVESISVTDNGRERFLPEDISDINMRRFFVHVLNFSVADTAFWEEEPDYRNKITLNMTDGSVHELRFSQQNERRLAVSVDGKPPVFACNIKDWQQIIEDLDALESGKGIRED